MPGLGLAWPSAARAVPIIALQTLARSEPGRSVLMVGQTLSIEPAIAACAVFIPGRVVSPVPGKSEPKDCARAAGPGAIRTASARTPHGRKSRPDITPPFLGSNLAGSLPRRI